MVGIREHEQRVKDGGGDGGKYLPVSEPLTRFGGSAIVLIVG